MEAGSTLPPVSSPKHSTGETGRESTPRSSDAKLCSKTTTAVCYWSERNWMSAHHRPTPWLCFHGLNFTNLCLCEKLQIINVCKSTSHITSVLLTQLNGGTHLKNNLCLWTYMKAVYYPVFSVNVNIFCRTFQTVQSLYM